MGHNRAHDFRHPGPRMSDFPTAGDPAPSDSDTLGAIPPAVTVTYCSWCGNSLTKGSHVTCRASLEQEPPRHCSSCRRELRVTTEGRRWSAVCKKHGESSGELSA